MRRPTRNRYKAATVLMGWAALFSLGCSSASDETQPTTAGEAAPEAPASPAPTPDAEDTSAAAPRPDPPPQPIEVAVYGGGTGPLPLRDPQAMRRLQAIGASSPPRVRLLSPSNAEGLDRGRLQIEYELEGYQVGESSGQHIQVVLDNTPYRADFSDRGSVSFSAAELPVGTHLLTVFPAHATHLSIKGEGSGHQVVFHVGKPSLEPRYDLRAPTLVYGRPKGDYSRADGSATNIMLDFYLFNVTLGPDGYRVRATVDGGPTVLLETWEPRIILTDPAPGEHTVRLELLDADGSPVSGPTNDTTRTITVSP